MKSRLDPDFIRQFSGLPRRVQEAAKRSYRRWQEDPRHPSLDFKRVHPRLPVYSVRVGLHYRAVGIERPDQAMLWFFIGSHAEYDRLLARL